MKLKYLVLVIDPIHQKGEIGLQKDRSIEIDPMLDPSVGHLILDGCLDDEIFIKFTTGILWTPIQVVEFLL